MSAPSLEPFNWIVPLSVLAASFVGSIHCVSMCGPLVLAVASDRKRQIAYQVGRFVSYTILGIVAGSLGQGMIGTLHVPWLSEVSLIFIALTLLAMGYRMFTGRGMHLRLPRFLDKAIQSIWSALRLAQLAPWASAALTGLLTVFLPCGHLYGFAAGAMATGHWWAGGLFMFAFWLGTLPALGFGASWLRSFFNTGLKRAPKWAGVLLIVAGLFGVLTFAMRLQAPAMEDHAGHGAHGTEQTTSHPNAFRCH